MTPASVCVALPVKNGASYLAPAIESVLSQSDVDLTLHVIDNRSRDDSLAIASRYLTDHRVRVDLNDQDILYYGSLNRALAETDAKYFVPFACDDLMLHGNLSRKLEALERTGAALAHSTSLSIDEQGAIRGVHADLRLMPPLVEPPAFFMLLVPENRLVCPSAVIRTESLRELGGFDARDDFAADWLAWLRISLRSPVVTLLEPLVGYRIHSASGTSRAERLGLRGHYDPPTVAQALADPAFPAVWSDWRDRVMAMTYSHVAGVLHGNGLRLLTRGWAPYMVQGRALARTPQDPEMRARYEQFVRGAGLTCPRVPFEAVAQVPRTPEDAHGLLSATEELGSLLGRLLIAAPATEQEEAIRVLEPLFGDSALDAVIVPNGGHTAELLNGRIMIARWGSAEIAQAESSGTPVWPYAIPDPFEHPADPTRYQTLAVAPPREPLLQAHAS